MMPSILKFFNQKLMLELDKILELEKEKNDWLNVLH